MKSIREIAHNIRVDAHAIWLCARDPATPAFARMFGLVVAAYALSPIDLIPDFIPVLGLLDDAILVPLGVWIFVRMVPGEIYARHRAEAEFASHRPVSKTAAAVIILIWLTAIGWAALLLWSARYY